MPLEPATRKHLAHAWAHSLAALQAIQAAERHLAAVQAPTPAHAPITRALPLVAEAAQQLAAFLDVTLSGEEGW